MSNTVKGYKVFNSDWTCHGKQYTCPGKFEEDVNLEVCKRGMHFCKKLLSCFRYYDFDHENKVAEVIAYGDVITDDDKSCTNKPEIVRELSWEEVLDMVNHGNNNFGKGNTGYRNIGNYNTGNHNSGYRNTGNFNAGNRNVGGRNIGNWNTGDQNDGDRNTGDRNIGNSNTGTYNSGYANTGSWNTGNWNSGDYNIGHQNAGDFNLASGGNGCFNTQEQKIYMFDKPTNWTLWDWHISEACGILKCMPHIRLVLYSQMTKAQKNQFQSIDAGITGNYLKKASDADRQRWWDKLPDKKKGIIKALPNFDPEIFKKVTGIDVEEEK